MRKSIIQKIFWIFFWIILVLFFLLVALYLFAALGRSYLGGETTFVNSSEYQFFQQPVTRIVTIRKGGTVQSRFFFYPHVFAVWVDKTRPYVFLVTSDTGTLDGAQGLYIYDGTKSQKVYQANSVEFAKGKKIPGRLYVSWFEPIVTLSDYYFELGKKRERIHNVFSLSPDGRYLFGYESGYEGGVGFIIDTMSMKKVENPLNLSHLYWSPDKTCAINFAYEYGDTQHVELVYYDGDELATKIYYSPSFYSTGLLDVFWGDTCNGVVKTLSDHDTQGNPRQIVEYYRFSNTSDELQKTSQPNLSQYRVSANIPRQLDNIFFTIMTPKFSE